jgi:hypothetical protein
MADMINNPHARLCSADMLCLSLKKGVACNRGFIGKETTYKSTICRTLKAKHLTHHVMYAERIEAGDWSGAVALRERCIINYTRDVAITSMEKSSERLEEMFAEEVAQALCSRKATEALERVNVMMASIAGLSLSDLEATHLAHEYGAGMSVDDENLDY